MQTQEEKEQTEEGEHQLKKFYFEWTVTDLLGVTTWHLLVSRLLPEFVMIELALEPWCFLPALWMFPSKRRVLTTLHFLWCCGTHSIRSIYFVGPMVTWY
jgi:hypothetical protein